MRFAKLASELRIGHALVENVANQFATPLPIASRFAVVEAESLLVDISKQMEGFNTHIGSVKSAFQQAPKAFHIISVDIAVYVFDGVIHYGVLIVSIKSVVGFQFIAKDCRASFSVDEPVVEVPF